MHTVYILKCDDKTIYVGCTSDLKSRLKRHNKGWVFATKYRLPVELVVRIVFKNKHKAYKLEKYLKTGSGRAFLNKRFI